MSGEIFQPMESLEDTDVAKRNPLLCYLCNEQYDDPCILSCFHSFCMRCLRGRAADSQMLCPLCGATTPLKEGNSLPPPDPLLKFMVESSLDEKASCANCDKDCNPMYFCNTCCQPLCTGCRDETHRAKMFAAHDIVVLSKRTKEIHKRCSLHKEPYIMFSIEKKIMLCINCFRDMRIESRTHCVDLETAYNQSCRKLEQSVQAVRDLQNSVRDGILLLRALLEEIKQNARKESEAVSSLYDSMQEKIKLTMETLLEESNSQYKAKESSFKAQLTGLTTLLPTIHVHLVTSAAFASSANKFEFLDMSYAMMERLKAIVHCQHPLHPTQGSQIDTDFKNKFAKSLEPLLYDGPGKVFLASSPVLQRSTGVPSSPSFNRIEVPKLANQAAAAGNTPVKAPQNNGRRNGIGKVKFIDAKGVFAEHCVEFETSHRDVLQKLEKLKSQVQELQRDLTLRRCLARRSAVEELKSVIDGVECQLEKHYGYIEEKQPTLEKHWEESVQRIANEQELYQAQCQDVVRLQLETKHLKVITAQLTSYISSIASVTERLAPKLGQSTNDTEHDNQMHALLDEINAVHPDSQQRVDAIQTAEDIRQVNTANRKNPLDDELIKTKGLLRAPSLRRDSSTKKDASTTQTVQGKDTAEEDKENIRLENVQPVKLTPT
ncbi:RING finger protein 207-like isoform X1 [Haliotis rufescens]|uniref:RING finger protein 207-like isoform X1 n=1 Tax=Haliotis rufescens TaxID=6454 RepID=UPI001EAFB6EC|nr:RING finger protein 207-like isoform X1 [Haliotis rufescens]